MSTQFHADDLYRTSIISDTTVIVQAWDGLAYTTLATFHGETALAKAERLLTSILDAEEESKRLAVNERGIAETDGLLT